MAERRTVYSLCGMCGTRCPIAVEVEDGAPRWICGNPHTSLRGALCARGAAGIAFAQDGEVPRQPLLRAGKRGEGLWNPVGWDEALDVVADALRRNAEKYGPQSLLWSDRGGSFIDPCRAFMRGMGSPNVCTHSVSCDLNSHHAGQAVMGLGRGSLVFDYAHCRYLVLQGRNLFESINVGECRAVLGAMRQGCRLAALDVRPSVTACKAHVFFRLRPGTDYAFNLAVLHVLLDEELYQKDYVRRYATGLEALRAFTRAYTPEWAEAETGTPASDLRAFVRELAAAAPRVIWHPGWMTTRYVQSFQVSRTAFVINALLGSLGVKGGIVPAAGPEHVGRKGLRKFTDAYPAPTVARADGAGTVHRNFDPRRGLLHRCFEAMRSGRPYPLKSYIAWRHDPLQAMPDPEDVKDCFAHLDLLVSVTFSWSDTAWHSDVVLPLSPYLARESILATKLGLKPQFHLRQRAMEPLYDTRTDWEIMAGLGRRLGLKHLDFSRIEDIWDFQLQDTGVTMHDFAATGFVPLTDSPHYPDADALVFPTPSGKLELCSEGWEAASGEPMLAAYASPDAPPAGAFRLVFGRVGVHTQGHTMNNPLLHEQMPCNAAWIHPDRAAELRLDDGALVDILDSTGRSAGTVPVRLSAGIHPEALFLVHGFGHRLPCESRAFGKGVADQELLPGGLRRDDAGGGGLALQEHFVTLRLAEGGHALPDTL